MKEIKIQAKLDLDNWERIQEKRKGWVERNQNGDFIGLQLREGLEQANLKVMQLKRRINYEKPTK